MNLFNRNIFKKRVFWFWVFLILFVISVSQVIYLFFQDNSFASPSSGGSYNESMIGDLGSINPLYVAYGTKEKDIEELIYSGLTKYDPQTNKFVADLANFYVSNDGKEYVYTLNPNAKWHDGQKVTADDVVFTYNIVKKPEFDNKVLGSSSAIIDKIVKVDDNTVKFVLIEPYLFFPVYTSLGILPKHIWEKVQDITQLQQNALNQKPIGSGPYKVEDILVKDHPNNIAKTVRLVKNNDYYGVNKPYIDNIDFEIFPDEDSMISNKESLDGIAYFTDQKADEIIKMNKYNIVEVDLPIFSAIYLNTDSKVFSQAKTRMALRLGLNLDEILADKNDIKLINTPFLENNKDYWELTYNLDSANGSLFDGGWKFYKDNEIDAHIRTLIQKETAKNNKEIGSGNTIISGSGATLGTGLTLNSRDEFSVENRINTSSGANLVSSGNQINNAEINLDNSDFVYSGRTIADLRQDFSKFRYDKNWDKLKIRILVLDTPYILPEIAQKIAISWEKLGADCEITIKDSKSIGEFIQKRDYDVIIISGELGYSSDLFAYWHSSQSGKNGYNLSNYRNFKLDTLINELRDPTVKVDSEGYAKYLSDKKSEIQKIFLQETPAIFLFQKITHIAVDNKIKGIDLKNYVYGQDRFANIQNWYILEKATLKQDFNLGNLYSWIRSKM